jgi:Rps23 Pro-64 3,4-dihydroxylase Tpa1-like proline 4-hydroxylase
MSSLQASSGIIQMGKLENNLSTLKETYQSNLPYPHISIDDFLDPVAAKKAMELFPKVKDAGWIHYVHVNEKKHGLNKMELLPLFIQEVIKQLNSKEFVSYLSKLTGIENLIADEMLEGGGLHQTNRGGFLNMHADFTVHPHKPHWRRRVNLLIYLNENWLPEYRGELELWERDMSKCVKKISPVFNRCVIFNTDEDSFHGVPDPIQCPDDMSRKSIALYYFTEEQGTPVMRSTNYRSRPGDGIKSIFIYLDKKFIAIYTSIKRVFGINDDVASKILNFFNPNKK